MNGDVFTIDLARCTGCQACRIACQDRAALGDDVDLLRIEREERGAFPAVRLTYRVVHCFHCARPACLPACPVAALTRTEQGLVALDGTACIGCGACIDACPFGAIVMLPGGMAAKCDGCPEQIGAPDSAGQCSGPGPGPSLPNTASQPTCVRACPMRALSFGPAAPMAGRMSDDAFDDGGIGPAVRYLRRPPAGGPAEDA
jgi:anaerobic dimethyl sulfoxide reductase subunit B (iron-sulfur subunit)